MIKKEFEDEVLPKKCWEPLPFSEKLEFGSLAL